MNNAIDISIKEMLPSFDEISQKRMVNAIANARKAAEKFRDENTDAGARHIFREFIPAYLLNQKGFSLEYEKTIQGKTPDWVDENAKLIVDSYTYERGGSAIFVDRLSDNINKKCNKYKDIISVKSFYFVVAVYIDFLSDTLVVECREEPQQFKFIFEANESLSAILFFSESNAVNKRQNYEFFCVCRDSFIGGITNWIFPTQPLIIA